MTLAYVYWLHLYDHYDPLSQGYIGVSTDPDFRCNRHLRLLREGKHDNIHLTHAYLRYKGNILHSIIYEGEEEDCYDEEVRLRPTRAIGWNIAEGGCKPPSQAGIPKSQSHRMNIGMANRGNKRPDLVKYNNTRKGIPQTIESNIKRSMTQKGRSLGPRSEATKEKIRQGMTKYHQTRRVS